MRYNVEIYATLLGRTGKEQLLQVAKWDKKFSAAVYVITAKKGIKKIDFFLLRKNGSL